MPATGQTQHQLAGVAGIARLAEHFVIEHNDGVGAEHQVRAGVAEQPPAGSGFGRRQASHQCIRRFTGKGRFVDVRIQDLEAHAKLVQQRAPSWGPGGKVDHSPR